MPRTAPATREFGVDARLFTGNATSFNVEDYKAAGAGNFTWEVRGIQFDNSFSDDDAQYAWVRGRLYGDGQVIRKRLTCGMEHAWAFIEIFRTGTTARGISLLGGDN